MAVGVWVVLASLALLAKDYSIASTQDDLGASDTLELYDWLPAPFGPCDRALRGKPVAGFATVTIDNLGEGKLTVDVSMTDADPGDYDVWIWHGSGLDDQHCFQPGVPTSGTGPNLVVADDRTGRVVLDFEVSEDIRALRPAHVGVLVMTETQDGKAWWHYSTGPLAVSAARR